ncbi:MAG: presqualene diphosphate synthase HpnD [Rhodospirillales bacterium]|nr:presqualene diphosphate synthase HpnD [Rhodospirillales bacterium]
MIENETETSDGEARAYIEAVVRRSGTSFYWAMRRLPKEKRRAMFAVYAFCREVDDIADEPGAVADKLRSLGAWRDEIQRLYAGTPTSLVTRGLVWPVSLFALCKKDFLAVIEGMEMDAAVTLRFGTMDELRRYCDCVACAVGRLSNRVFGIGEEMGNRVAGALGEALQLTNILRDVHEDAERDRLYLPADLLARHGISDGALPAVLDHPNLALACAEFAEVTERRFAEADTLLATCDRRQMRPAMMMMAMYRRILLRLARRGWRRLAEPVTLSKLEKIWILIRHGTV